ncbi:CLOCK [Lepeophtheirus salmonis]|uniref:CLOCK n=1 Tax=Lepeophtheirus salmonis TaxID=72036 RepID=A0A7R8CH60_LEPSM|nr:CLOCK [Lepeophtheirus salmonis]CAF2782475.1 CLOCK [Lepeophtheirus salmonis]
MEVTSEEQEDFKRKSRNLSEKKRRDKFNVYVTELGNMVNSWDPSLSSKYRRKMDKTTVLKSTILFIKKHQPKQLIEQLQQNQEISECGYVNDPPLPPLENLGANISSLESKPTFLSHNEFTQIMLESVHGADGRDLELAHLVGYFRPWTRYSTVFVSAVRLQGSNRPKENKKLTPHMLLSANELEFTSRYSLEWKFLYIDDRAPPIIGYLPFEVLGTSGYDYYHIEDLERVCTYHATLMQTGEVPSCFYIVFLQRAKNGFGYKHGIMFTYNHWNAKPEFVVATHKVVRHVDDTKKVKKEGGEDWDNTIENTLAFIKSYSSSFSDSIFDSFGARSPIGLSSKKFEDSGILNLFASPQVKSILNNPNSNFKKSFKEKHDELSFKICQQQEQLQTISDKLIMSKYGLDATNTERDQKINNFSNDSREPTPKRSVPQGRENEYEVSYCGPFGKSIENSFDNSLADIIWDFGEEEGMLMKENDHCGTNR